MGCLGRLGCLVVLLVGGAVGYWLYGDRLPTLLSRSVERTAIGVSRAAERVSERLDRPASESADASTTERSSSAPDSASGARDRMADDARGAVRWVPLGSTTTGGVDPVRALRAPNAPAYVTLSASQVAALLAPLRAALPPSAGRPDIAVVQDQLLLRTAIARRDFVGSGALGALIGATMDGVDTLAFAGVFEPVRPGLSQFRVQSLTVDGIEIPARLIPPVARRIRRVTDRARIDGDSARTTTGADLGGVADDALPVRLPRLVADIRIVNGRLTVYRNVPGRSR